MAQLVKNPPAMPKTWVPSLGWEDHLQKRQTTHSSILAWRIPWHPKESNTNERLFTLIPSTVPGTEQALSEWWLDEQIIMNEKVLVHLNVFLLYCA